MTHSIDTHSHFENLRQQNSMNKELHLESFIKLIMKFLFYDRKRLYSILIDF